MDSAYSSQSHPLKSTIKIIRPLKKINSTQGRFKEAATALFDFVCASVCVYCLASVVGWIETTRLDAA